MMMQSESTVSDITVPASNETKDESIDVKVLTDLSTLEEQIDLCQTMLSAERDVDSDEALLAVIGFLEACVPRMVELIQAGMQGALREKALEKCFLVNDRLCRTLEDCDEPDPSKRTGKSKTASSSGEGGGVVMTTAAAAAQPRSETEVEFDHLFDSAETPSESPSSEGKGGTGDDEDGGGTKVAADPFAGTPELLTPTPMTAVNPSISGDNKDNFDKEFDDFLKERSVGDKNDE